MDNPVFSLIVAGRDMSGFWYFEKGAERRKKW